MAEPEGIGARARDGWRAAAGVLIAVAFIAFVEWYVGWSILLRPWRALPPVAVALPAVLFGVTYFARAMRLHAHFHEALQGRRRACLRLVLRHNLFNNLLPMRTGELAFPVLMARTFGVPASSSVPGLVWLRALDLHAVLLFALVAVLWRVPTVAAAAAVAWLALPWLGWRLGRRAGTALRGRRRGSAGRLIERCLDGLPDRGAVFWRVQGWTLATWGLKLAVFAWVLALFAPLGVGAALLGAIGGEVTSVLPIHGLAGMGTYEAGVAAGLAPAGVDPASVVRAAVNLHLFLLGVSVVAGGLAFVPLRREVTTPRPARTNDANR